MRIGAVKADGPARRRTALVLMWGGWMSAIGFGSWAALSFDPEHGHFAPTWVNLVFIFSIGVAIASGSAVSRIKLAQTIVEAFKAGFQASTMHHAQGVAQEELLKQRHKTAEKEDDPS